MVKGNTIFIFHLKEKKKKPWNNNCIQRTYNVIIIHLPVRTIMAPIQRAFVFSFPFLVSTETRQGGTDSLKTMV